MTYRFLGATATLGGEIELDRYGQKVELSQEDAEAYIARGVALLPDESFAGGHSDAELQKYPSIGLQHDAPPEFVATRARLWGMIHDRRVELMSKEGK